MLSTPYVKPKVKLILTCIIYVIEYFLFCVCVIHFILGVMLVICGGLFKVVPFGHYVGGLIRGFKAGQLTFWCILFVSCHLPMDPDKAKHCVMDAKYLKNKRPSATKERLVLMKQQLLLLNAKKTGAKVNVSVTGILCLQRRKAARQKTS